MKVESTDYGFIAYLLLKYDSKIEKVEKSGNNIYNYIINVETDKFPEDLIKEYKKTDFSIYNDLLKYVIKKSKG